MERWKTIQGYRSNPGETLTRRMWYKFPLHAPISDPRGGLLRHQDLFTRFSARNFFVKAKWSIGTWVPGSVTNVGSALVWKWPVASRSSTRPKQRSFAICNLLLLYLDKMHKIPFVARCMYRSYHSFSFLISWTSSTLQKRELFTLYHVSYRK